jgi:hypothetical protein
MPHVGNAISNIDILSGGWGGPACPNGYCFLILDEVTGDIVVQYRDSGGTPRAAVIGNYAPGNVARYGGGAPATTLRTGYFFQVNEAKAEVDFYYNDSGGTFHGPIPVSSYGPGNLAIFTGAAPVTVGNYYSWFVVNETGGLLDWYYRDSGAVVHGPIELATYATTGAWTTYTPSWSIVGSGGSPNSIQGSYIQTAKTVNLQIVASWAIQNAVSTISYVIGLPVSTYTGAGSFPQTLYATFGNIGAVARVWNLMATGTAFSFNVDEIANSGNVFFRFNGSYQTN